VIVRINDRTVRIPVVLLIYSILTLAGGAYTFLIARAANLIAQSELRYLDTVEARLTTLGQPLQQPQAAPAQKEKK
jgi:hypothetical protein